MANSNDASKLRLAFIDVKVFDDGSIRGGILVTDSDTKPYEFRITSPILPTQLQKILYGSSLTDYVYGEIICVPLINSIKEDLSLVISRFDYLLISRPKIRVPMISINNKSLNTDATQIPHSQKAFTIGAHKNYPNEKAVAETILYGLMADHDLLEPFDRLKSAMDEVHRSKSGN
jgi:hypothetical protein